MIISIIICVIRFFIIDIICIITRLLFLYVCYFPGGGLHCPVAFCETPTKLKAKRIRSLKRQLSERTAIYHSSYAANFIELHLEPGFKYQSPHDAVRGALPAMGRGIVRSPCDSWHRRAPWFHRGSCGIFCSCRHIALEHRLGRVAAA